MSKFKCISDVSSFRCTLGDSICAPLVTGTDEEPCSMCEENNFGYDPITGCQECRCAIDGTINRNISCSLESGNC